MHYFARSSLGNSRILLTALDIRSIYLGPQRMEEPYLDGFPGLFTRSNTERVFDSERGPVILKIESNFTGRTPVFGLWLIVVFFFQDGQR